jgi:hypothetical protein
MGAVGRGISGRHAALVPRVCALVWPAHSVTSFGRLAVSRWRELRPGLPTQVHESAIVSGSYYASADDGASPIIFADPRGRECIMFHRWCCSNWVN